MRITTKGQVTIPQEIRHELFLLPNTEVIVDGEARRGCARQVAVGSSHVAMA